MRFHILRGWYPVLMITLIIAACNLQTTSQNTSTTEPIPSEINQPPKANNPSLVPTVTSQKPANQASQQRIGIRIIDGTGEFYDRVTGKKFVPRGMNYIRLAWQTKADGTRVFGHSLFDPGKYDQQRVSKDFVKMRTDGYNVVRVFLSPDTMGTETGGLSSGYMDNIADFLKLAKENEIYVMFTLDWIPGGKYGQILNQDCCSTFALMNANFLPSAGLKANQAFYQDFIRELYSRDAPVEMVFAYELRNEMFYDGDQPPVSMTTGIVTTANGKSYDMSSPTDKQRMLDENLVDWINSMRASILEIDPSALVSVGFFQPQLPNASRIGDTRIAVTEPAIWQSEADFVDLHAYPGFELNLKQYVENFGIKDMQKKPIIMGEFGGEVKRFASLESATQTFVDWQVESCNYGFDGWIFWTWDLSEQPDFFNAFMGDGQIEKALAPITRPDPCTAGTSSSTQINTNIALNAAATASLSLADQSPANAVDGNPNTQWGAGSSAPQWIEIDLGKPSTINSFHLIIAQYPNGKTIHQIWVRGANDSLRLIHEFNGNTIDIKSLNLPQMPHLPGFNTFALLQPKAPPGCHGRKLK